MASPAGRANRGESHGDDGTTFDVVILLNMFRSLSSRQQTNLESILAMADEDLYPGELSSIVTEGRRSHHCFVLRSLVLALKSTRKNLARRLSDQVLVNAGVDILQQMAHSSVGNTVAEFTLGLQDMLRYSDETTTHVAPAAASMPANVGGSSGGKSEESFPESTYEIDADDPELLKRPVGDFSLADVPTEPDQASRGTTMSNSESSNPMPPTTTRRMLPPILPRMPAGASRDDGPKHATRSPSPPGRGQDKKKRNFPDGKVGYICGKCGKHKKNHICEFEKVSRKKLREWSDALKKHLPHFEHPDAREDIAKIIHSIESDYLDSDDTKKTTTRKEKNKSITAEGFHQTTTLPSMVSNPSTAVSNDAPAVAGGDSTDNRDTEASGDGSESSDNKSEEMVSRMFLHPLTWIALVLLTWFIPYAGKRRRRSSESAAKSRSSIGWKSAAGGIGQSCTLWQRRQDPVIILHQGYR
jgi:hypothetical protein